MNSLRSQALSKEAANKFIDPISLDLMTDPVSTADGQVYIDQVFRPGFKRCEPQEDLYFSFD